MPEQRECVAHALTIQWGLEDAIWAGYELTVRALFYDATDKEAPRVKAKEGLAIDLPSTSKAKRGQRFNQTHLYPVELEGAPLSTLVLRAVHGYYRGIVLDMTVLSLQLQWLIHTSAQWYTMDMWENGVLQVAKKVRGFKVGLAMVFDQMVLAFVSNDLVFQPTWSHIPYRPPPNVYESPKEYLELLADWIEKNFFDEDTRSNQLIGDAMRANQVNFQGVGKYTADELCFLAGISPFLTSCQVFVNPSRTARLIVAFHAFATRSEQDLPSLLRPAIMDGLVAPYDRMREDYFTEWIYINRKNTVEISQRMGKLYRDYTASESAEPFDVFEPALILESIEALGLGPLIFGTDEWASLGRATPAPNPLSSFYRLQDGELAPTHLKCDRYFAPLKLSTLELRATRRIPTLLFEGPEKKIWSLLPPPQDVAIAIKQLEGPKREKELFTHIIRNTLEVAEGPLEYRGNGQRIAVGKSTRVAACRGDPRFSAYHTEKNVRSIVRHKGVGRKLDLKQGLDNKENRSVEKEVRKRAALLDAGYERLEKKRKAEEHGEDGGGVIPPPKKKRRSADKVLSGIV
ncbi:hypothetical protein C8F01DRAFT_1234933 [Mycena amicta]|nr:hypothetical protein C8F01DRAFT_1234933 [Mycena amicta]